MNVTPICPAVPPGGLAGLGDVTLSPEHQRMLDEAARVSGGINTWRQRKRVEARDLLALAQIAPRLQVMALDLQEPLKALLTLHAPVPCLPNPSGDLVVVRPAVLGLTYPEEALRQQLPGWAFLQLLAPEHVWHANVSTDEERRLCLGPRLPAGIRVKELVLMAYGALSMQTVQIDEQDPAGVLNAEAARWWQQNVHRLPLSRATFLSTEP